MARPRQAGRQTGRGRPGPGVSVLGTWRCVPSGSDTSMP